jgi:hypothetical protein
MLKEDIKEKYNSWHWLNPTEENINYSIVYKNNLNRLMQRKCDRIDSKCKR